MKGYCEQFRNILNTTKNVDLSVIFCENISTPEFLILSLIDHISQSKNSDSVWVSDIVERCSVTAQAISKLLRAMEEKGYIQRYTDAHDRRRTQVVLSESGKSLYAGLYLRFEKLIHIISEGFDEGEFSQFLCLFQKFGNLFSAGVRKLSVEK